MSSILDIKKVLKQLGINHGDTVLTHSSFKSLGPVNGGPKIVIKALKDTVGNVGTLLFPTYTFEFCKQFNRLGIGFWDIDNTPSEMGIITEVARKQEDAIRTLNPIYSHVIIGKDKYIYGNCDDNNVFGHNSVFAQLHRTNGKILTIGLPPNRSWTLLHYLEERKKVSYRSHKIFSGFIISHNQFKFDKYMFRVRNEFIKTNIEPMISKLIKDGIIKECCVGNCKMQITSAVDFYDAASDIMDDNPQSLFEYDHNCVIREKDVLVLEEYVESEKTL